MKKNKLLFVQLNEINFDELKKYSKNYNFKFFNDIFFEQLISTKSETEYQLLEPWIQWVSIYTGLDAKQHKIFRLGDIENKSYTQFYEIVEQRGYSVGAISPMNLKNNLKNALYFIPDPWSDSNSNNKWIDKHITKTIKKFVNENSSKNKSFSDYLRLLFIFLTYFRLKNLRLLFKLTFGIKHHWNKALLCEYILNNIHLKKINKYNPDFSSIFFNAGAHIQHHYYFNSKFFDKFENPDWYVKKKYDPVFEMFKFYDKLLFEYNNKKKYDLIIATGLRQIPYDRIKYYYRLKNHKEFLSLININYKDVIPKMSRDFIIYFKNVENKENAIKIFEEINLMNQKKIFSIDGRENSIFVTLIFSEEIKDNFEIKIRDNKKINLSEYVNFIALKNGMHDQEGYYYSNFTDPSLKNNQHIKNIFEVITNYF